MTIRVLIVDDHKIMREGLAALMDKQPGVEVLGEASDGREAVALAQELSPDVVIMDVAMTGLNGVEATRRITAAVPDTRVIALSIHGDRRFVARMLQAGASGYVLKGGSFDELVQAIRAVARGQAYLTPAVAGALTEDYAQGLSADARRASALLSPREREVLQLLAEGRNTKQVAADLGITRSTVGVHRHRIMRKLNVDSAAEMIKWAIREGLASLTE